MTEKPQTPAPDWGRSVMRQSIGTFDWRWPHDRLPFPLRRMVEVTR